MSTLSPSPPLPPQPSQQVSALPIGSGGNNVTKQQLNQINTNLTMLSAQAVADQKYDPPSPVPIIPPSVKEGFRAPFVPQASIYRGMMAIGVGCILYGLFTDAS